MKLKSWKQKEETFDMKSKQELGYTTGTALLNSMDQRSRKVHVTSFRALEAHGFPGRDCLSCLTRFRR